MKPLNAGELRHRIMLQERADIANDFGEPVPSWSSRAILWAKVEPISGRDLQLLRSLGGTETHKITLRYYPDLIADGTLRIAFPPPGQFSSAFAPAFNGGSVRSRVFTLSSVLNVEERNYQLTVMATEDLRQ